MIPNLAALFLLLPPPAACPPPVEALPLYFGVVEDGRLRPIGVCGAAGCGVLRSWPKDRFELAEEFQPASAARVPAEWWGAGGPPPATWFLPRAEGATPVRLGGAVKVRVFKGDGWAIATNLPRWRPGEETPPLRLALSEEIPWDAPRPVAPTESAGRAVRALVTAELARLERRALRGRSGRAPGIGRFGTAEADRMRTGFRAVASGEAADGSRVLLAELFRFRGDGDTEPVRVPGSPTSTIEAFLRQDADGSLRILSSRHWFDEEWDSDFEYAEALGFFEIGGRLAAVVRYGREAGEHWSIVHFCAEGATRIPLWGPAGC